MPLTHREDNEFQRAGLGECHLFGLDERPAAQLDLFSDCYTVSWPTNGTMPASLDLILYEYVPRSFYIAQDAARHWTCELTLTELRGGRLRERTSRWTDERGTLPFRRSLFRDRLPFRLNRRLYGAASIDLIIRTIRRHEEDVSVDAIWIETERMSTRFPEAGVTLPYPGSPYSPHGVEPIPWPFDALFGESSLLHHDRESVIFRELLDMMRNLILRRSGRERLL